MHSRLQRARTRAALTQAQVAFALDISREMISMWENGSRTPGPEALSQLAELYGTNVQQLKGASPNEGEAPDWERQNREVLSRIADYSTRAREEAKQEVERWTGCLDGWARFLESVGAIEPGQIAPGRPPKEIDEGFGITDARRASTLARTVRDHYDLGQDAIPALYSFLDEVGVLVYKAPLGPVGEQERTVSGAFYNHPRVGYSILVNVRCSKGRQAFTLAHELAHALFHYSSQALVSVGGDDDPKERFANAFAAHFLVPHRRLRELCRKERRRSGSLGPFSVLRFAAYFRVSYLMMLFRLHEERQISRIEVNAWKDYSPVQMAGRIGLDPGFLMSPEQHPVESGGRESLWRYPVSAVLWIREALKTDEISPGLAAEILQVNMDPQELEKKLVDIPKRDGEGGENLDEYPIRWRSLD